MYFSSIGSSFFKSILLDRIPQTKKICRVVPDHCRKIYKFPLFHESKKSPDLRKWNICRIHQSQPVLSTYSPPKSPCAFSTVPFFDQDRLTFYKSISLELLNLLKSIVSRCQNGLLVSIYSHENNEIQGRLHFNCYGFIGYLLQKIYPSSYEAVVQFMHANQDRIPTSIDKIPCPFHYAAFFLSLTDHENKYWSTFRDFRAVCPGDLIVYLPRNYTPKEVSKIQTERTGTHLMLVEEILEINQDRIKLMVIDCTRSPHCSEDSRVKGGIGRAPLTIFNSPQGTTLQWGSRKKKLEKDLFLGRLKIS